MNKIFVFFISFIFLFQLNVKAQNKMNQQPNKMNQQGNKMGCVLNSPSATIDLTEINFIKYSREEAKMAKDLYDLFYNMYQLENFINISTIKQKNNNQITCIINHYKINDIGTDTKGIYNDLNIQQLYDNLKTKGSLSINDALSVGALLEEIEINNFNTNLRFTANPAIISQLKNFHCNSKNNLRALIAEINSNGGTYIPQYLDAKEYAKILKKKNERCTLNITPNNQQGQGQGQGKGSGKGSGQNRGQGRY